MTVHVHRNEGLVQTQKSPARTGQVSGIQSGAYIFEILFAVRSTEWTSIGKRPGLPQRLQCLVIPASGSEIAGLKVFLQLPEVGPALIKKAVQIAIDRV